MKISCVQPQQLDRKQIDAWRRLQVDLYDNPFFSPEYTRLVSEVRDDVRVAVLEMDQPVGFFPFQIGAAGGGRPVGVRLTDFQGPIVSGVDIDVASLLRECGLNAWHFDHLVPSCATLQPYIYGTAGSPYIDIHGGFEAYCESRRQAGSSAIKQFERKTRKLAREVGPLRFEMHSSSREVFDSLIRWKSEYIRQKGAYRLLDLPWVLELLERIWQTDTPSFVGRLSALYAGDKLIANHLGICNENVCHWWITTYDTTYHTYSPGAILLLNVAKAAAEAGMRRLDLGKGEEQYKRRLMSGEILLGEGNLTRWPLQRMFGRALYRSRARIRNSALDPFVQKSKQVFRHGPWSAAMSLEKSADG